MPKQTTGEVRLEDENSVSSTAWEGLVQAGWPPIKAIASRIALNIAWGGREAYCVAKIRAHTGNIGLMLFHFLGEE